MSTSSPTEVDVDPDATPEPTTPKTPVRAKSLGLFRAFWRWHFYASLVVIPILAILATTGLLYLYRWQIDPIMHPGLLTVSVPDGKAPLALTTQEAAVHATYPEANVTAVQQGGDNRATYFTITQPDDSTTNVYVNPYNATVLGSLKPEELLSNIAVLIHGQIIVGKVSEIPVISDPLKALNLGTSRGENGTLTIADLGDRTIELGACWAIVMALTGYYLYFRGRATRARQRAAGAKGSATRNRHALVGALIGGGFLLLVFSGLPWTGLWGNVVQTWATGHGSNLWGDDPGASSTIGKTLVAIGSTSQPAPWAEGAGPVPQSGMSGDMPGMPGMSGGDSGTTANAKATIDDAVKAAAGSGLAGPYYVTYPADEKGVFSVLGDQWHDRANPAFSDVSKERTVHVDQYTGQAIAGYGYGDYSLAAKVVSQGIALHEGRRFGSLNQALSTVFCFGVLFLCITGPMMWWRRRPKGGGIAAPRGAMPLRAAPWLTAIVVLLGLLLPMFGLSLLVVLVVDQVLVRTAPRLGALVKRA